MSRALVSKVRRIALISSLVYLVLQVLDVYVTYLITPDLHREANIMVARFDLGWRYIILSATIACLIMFIGQFWAWNKLVSRFPSGKQGYQVFYHHLLYDQRASSGSHTKHDLKGVLASITLIILNSLIAAKLLVVIWNLLILLFAIRVSDFTQVVLMKNVIAGFFGLFMFFVYPYLLHKQY